MCGAAQQIAFPSHGLPRALCRTTGARNGVDAGPASAGKSARSSATRQIPREASEPYSAPGVPEPENPVLAVSAVPSVDSDTLAQLVIRPVPGHWSAASTLYL